MHGSEVTRRQHGSAPQPEADKPSLAIMLAAQDEQLALCRELEDIADSLPGSVNRQKCIYAAQALGTLMKRTHAYEEDVFFPWLERGREADDRLASILKRLRYEHFEDECYAEELMEVLLKLGRGDPVNMEATGYMLRGFFEARRRHIAFERDHLHTYMRP
ncbi:hemerythrin domain-containing protein [Gellertiella hungarica]|uniref:Hemerythrin-like domain-containing protein n=1 Tax=Gellertiella hungarica TaxID=1572859 RepID=A0A7W6NN07_9HYPH|nr:hemerythrin domain-containing protein [Gellertiella hungarica]MBB4066970.1 hemerythrin-like domain-containing protein [Gellertiella hungarica]